MKPQLLKVTNSAICSFSVRRDTVPFMNNHWHYHQEVELVFFKNGYGTQFIGDSVKRFQAGDVVLVGSNLPHYWRFDDHYFDSNEKISADVSVVHFTEDFLGDHFLNLPENKLIKTTLEFAKRGLQVQGKTSQYVGEAMNRLLEAEGTRKTILLLEILSEIGKSQQVSSLSSVVFHPNLESPDDDRINAIYDYTMHNFRLPVKLVELAEVANISPSSFCRYFKIKPRKTYTQFINEVRVGHACKLLMEIV